VPDTADGELIAQVRAGGLDAYAVLYRRHVGAARTLAGQLTGCPAEADDLVAEAFARLLGALVDGGGPDDAFRAYLLTTLRHLRYDRARRDRRVTLSDDMTRYEPGQPWQDTAVAAYESGLVARAFAALPERWRAVLWRVEIEQESVAEVARSLGLTPNGVAALSYRARERLRQAYLQEHLPAGTGGTRADAHRVTVDRLGAWVRGTLSPGRRAQVDAHLAGCRSCRVLAVELADVGAGLRRGPTPRPGQTPRRNPAGRPGHGADCPKSPVRADDRAAG
jgi:RNA polymerase sigma factor (sigma-70 family)